MNRALRRMSKIQQDLDPHRQLKMIRFLAHVVALTMIRKHSGMWRLLMSVNRLHLTTETLCHGSEGRGIAKTISFKSSVGKKVAQKQDLLQEDQYKSRFFFKYD